jgi:sulfide:quinone oxidoreductase
MTDLPNASHRVLVAGGGVAGLEALCALRDLAGDISLTLLEPNTTFGLEALSVRGPFAGPAPARYRLDDVCRRLDVRHVRGTLAEVRPEQRDVVLADGETLAYDTLLVALGARPHRPYRHAHTFTGSRDAEAVHGIVQDLEGGYLNRIAFVVPPGTSWPLPLYELALQTAERAADMGLGEIGMVVVTPEDRPLEVLGRAASDDVAAVLAENGIELRTELTVTAVEHGVVHAVPGEVRVEAERVITLPQLHGRRIPGLPMDPEGFIPVEDDGRVRGVDGVFAAGDGTNFAVKQGGLAAQQADVAAVTIARDLGASLEPAHFSPVLDVQLLTGTGTRFVRHQLAGEGDGPPTVARGGPMRHPLRKVAAPRLVSLLEDLKPAPRRRDGDTVGSR